MNIDEFLEFIDYKITDGGEYLWKCFGKNTRYIESGDDYASDSIAAIVDAKTRIVYVLEFNGVDWDANYRWINPLYKDAYYAEAKERGVDPDQTYDDVKYQDFATVEEWKEQVNSKKGEE